MTTIAVRNLRLCTKDCLCLYVCPVGATDTEDSIIDTKTCIGCGACADACPSGAISMVPLAYPPQQKKAGAVVAAANHLAECKAGEEQAARQVAAAAGQDGLRRLMLGISQSSRLVAEDVLREAGFMLPQSGNTHALLEELLANPPGTAFPVQAAEQLLALLPNNDQPEADTPPEIWRCRVCGYLHEGPLPPAFTCPVCRQPAEAFEKQGAAAPAP